MKYEGLWAHFWSHAGFSSLLRHFLATSQLRLGRVHRVVNAEDSVELWATERSREVREQALVNRSIQETNGRSHDFAMLRFGSR